MSPGGHLATTAAACAATGLAAGALAPGAALPLVAGVAMGGFLIDVDHAVDYVVFDRQRDLRPATFLRYYLEGRMRRVVLLLHSYELLVLLGVLAWWLGSALLWGYLAGAVLHLALDIKFNGELTAGSLVPFYSVIYRARGGFDAGTLLRPVGARVVPETFWAAFFADSAPGDRSGTRATGRAASDA